MKVLPQSVGHQAKAKVVPNEGVSRLDPAAGGFGSKALEPYTLIQNPENLEFQLTYILDMSP